MAKVKIPKRVGGVKIPKKVRRKANKALKVAETPMVREIAAAALGAVAQKRADESERPASRSTGGRTTRLLAIDGDRLAETIRDAALDGFRRFLEGFEEGLRKASSGVEEGEKGGRRPANDRSAAAAAE